MLFLNEKFAVFFKLFIYIANKFVPSMVELSCQFKLVTVIVLPGEACVLGASVRW